MFKTKVAICSGFFNPLLSHHIDYFNGAKKYGLVHVLVNNDKQVKLKGSYEFLDEKTRLKLVQNQKQVAWADITIDNDNTVASSLEKIFTDAPDSIEFTFCNGGDRSEGNTSNKEEEVCKKFGVKVVYNVGGGKTGSSSETLQKFLDRYWQEAKPCPRIHSLDPTLAPPEWMTTFGGEMIPSHKIY